MTLLCLLLVLAAERMATKSTYWQIETYFSKYYQWIEGRNWLSQSSSNIALLIFMGLPALITYWVFAQFPGALWQLAAGSAVLMVCVGCPSLRDLYKCYLQAANRGDFEACSLYADQIGYCKQNNESFGQNLVWLNYRYYAGVVIWFALLGPAGAVLFTVARSFEEYLTDNQHPLADTSQKVMQFLDWLPVRIVALGILFVGHFSRALPVWLKDLVSPERPAKKLLCEVAEAAEDVEIKEGDWTTEPCTLVRLAKRNIMFILVFISIVTLMGWID